VQIVANVNDRRCHTWSQVDHFSFHCSSLAAELSPVHDCRTSLARNIYPSYLRLLPWLKRLTATEIPFNAHSPIAIGHFVNLSLLSSFLLLTGHRNMITHREKEITCDLRQEMTRCVHTMRIQIRLTPTTNESASKKCSSPCCDAEPPGPKRQIGGERFSSSFGRRI
jgi:hypothetical protein